MLLLWSSWDIVLFCCFIPSVPSSCSPLQWWHWAVRHLLFLPHPSPRLRGRLILVTYRAVASLVSTRGPSCFLTGYIRAASLSFPESYMPPIDLDYRCCRPPSISGVDQALPLTRITGGVAHPGSVIHRVSPKHNWLVWMSRLGFEPGSTGSAVIGLNHSAAVLRQYQFFFLKIILC